MKFVKILFLIVLSVFFVGCGGRYKYNVEPTPIQKGVAKYIVSDFNLTLTNNQLDTSTTLTIKMKASFVMSLWNL